jgi:hypothetical protein
LIADVPQFLIVAASAISGKAGPLAQCAIEAATLCLIAIAPDKIHGTFTDSDTRLNTRRGILGCDERYDQLR